MLVRQKGLLDSSLIVCDSSDLPCWKTDKLILQEKGLLQSKEPEASTSPAADMARADSQQSVAAKETASTSTSTGGGQAQHTRPSQDRRRGATVEPSNSSQTSSSGRDGGGLEARLLGWKDRLSKSIDGTSETADSAQSRRGIEGSQRSRNEGKKVETAEPPGVNFTGRMSNMFAAASNTLRPSSAKKDEPKPRSTLVTNLHKEFTERCYTVLALY